MRDEGREKSWLSCSSNPFISPDNTDSTFNILSVPLLLLTTNANMASFETRLFINGQYVAAKTSSRLTCYSAFDNSVVSAAVHVAEKEDVDDAVVGQATRREGQDPAQVG
jgi:hypothetical protein